MVKQIVISKLLTREMKPLDSLNTDRRLFRAVLTAENLDKQAEMMVMDNVEKVLPIWMARGAPVSDTHTNRIVGKGNSWHRTEIKDDNGELIPAIIVEAEIYKDYQLDDEIWEKIKNGEYAGVSFGGAAKGGREPIKMSDGRFGYRLGDLEQYEMAVCKSPANPLSLIVDYNSLAKSMPEEITRMNMSTVNDAGHVKLKCDGVVCFVEKSDITVQVHKPKQTMEITIPEGDPEDMYKDEEVEIDKKSARKDMFINQKDGEKGRMGKPEETQKDVSNMIGDTKKLAKEDKKEEENEEEEKAFHGGEGLMTADEYERMKRREKEEEKKKSLVEWRLDDIVKELKSTIEEKVGNIEKDMDEKVRGIVKEVIGAGSGSSPNASEGTKQAIPNKTTQFDNKPYNNPDQDTNEDEEGDDVKLETGKSEIKKSARPPIGTSGNIPSGQERGLNPVIKAFREGKSPSEIAKELSNYERVVGMYREAGQ